MNDLSHMMREFERAELSTVGLVEANELSRRSVRSAVVRKRTIRAVSMGVAATAAVVALGAGAWAVTSLSDRTPVLSSTSPSPSPSPTPSVAVVPVPSFEPATATAEPAQGFEAFEGGVIVDPALPSALPLTEEAWLGATDGWAIVTYREDHSTYDAASRTVTESQGPQVIYLVSPSGERFQLTAVEGTFVVRIVAWDPQSTTALAILDMNRYGMGAKWVAVDLTTGITRQLTDEDVAASQWKRQDVDDIASATTGSIRSDSFMEIPGYEPLLAIEAPLDLNSPDNSAAVATAQALVPADETCDWSLTLATSVVVACGALPADSSDDGVGEMWEARHFVFVADSGKGAGTVVDVRQSNPGESTLGLGNHDWLTGDPIAVGDTVIAGQAETSEYGCPSGRALATKDGVTPLPGVESLKAIPGGVNIFSNAGQVGSLAYTQVTGGCSGSQMATALVVDDVATGQFTVLVPFPTLTTSGQTAVAVYGSLESVFVVGGRG